VRILQQIRKFVATHGWLVTAVVLVMPQAAKFTSPGLPLIAPFTVIIGSTASGMNVSSSRQLNEFHAQCHCLQVMLTTLKPA
jgi:hypothetical protein